MQTLGARAVAGAWCTAGRLIALGNNYYDHGCNYIYACAPLIDGLGLATQTVLAIYMYLSQASCVIVSGFTAALDLVTYPLRNLIRPRCAERAKPGRGKPVLIMHIGFLACFHAISLERSRFSKIATSIFLPLWH